MDRITHLAGQLGQALHARQLQVATAESCTGGGIAEAITRIAGSSQWFEAGYVTYSSRQKTRQLGVPQALLDGVGAVSREVVEAMARGAREHSGAQLAVAVSGIAGPDGGSPATPVGTVWLAWQANECSFSCRCRFAGDRQAVREQTVIRALEGLLRLTAGENPAEG